MWLTQMSVIVWLRVITWFTNAIALPIEDFLFRDLTKLLSIKMRAHETAICRSGKNIWKSFKRKILKTVLKTFAKTNIYVYRNQLFAEYFCQFVFQFECVMLIHIWVSACSRISFKNNLRFNWKIKLHFLRLYLANN